ncbi:MAG: hypothetical protein KDJ22_09015 [Candidatus Competibacteraceae bacterium]|nr:hypothetical protein [Candidatus Competibacteraceae bacterium]
MYYILLQENDNKGANRQVNLPKYVILDTETLSWGAREPIRDINQVPSCWVQTEILKPSEFGLDWQILKALQISGYLLPTTAKEKITRSLDNLT